MTAQIQTIVVRRNLDATERADAEAARNELTRRGTLVVNLVSSPGAGKTSLLEATAARLADTHRLGILVGDLETTRDAQRLEKWAPTAQLTTGGACHLELPLVRRGLQALGETPLDFLFIENVGNLVCPASHDLGEHLRVVLLSTTEGDDKPGKYPKMFRMSQAMLITKLDLLPHVPFSTSAARADALRVQPDLDVMQVCSLDGTGMDAWTDYLIRMRTRLVNPVLS